MKARILLAVLLTTVWANPGEAMNYYVSPKGDDANSGTKGRPFRSVARARDAVRRSGRAGRTPVTVLLHGGTYYLGDTLVFTPRDSGTVTAPVTYAGVPGSSSVISGGTRLDLAWARHKGGIMKAQVPKGLAFDQLFVDGRRQHMVRYPNYNPKASPYNGAAADAFSPQRAARWKDPTGGFIHAMHRAHWADTTIGLPERSRTTR